MNSPWVLRARYDDLVRRLPTLPGEPLLQTAWAVAGFLVGGAVAESFRWSGGPFVLAALLGAVLAWWGRGITTLVVAGTTTLALVSVAFRATMVPFPHEVWSMTWLGPLSLLLFVGSVAVGRAIGVNAWSEARLSAGLLDLAAGIASLGLAWGCVHRIAGNLSSTILLSSEDNGAWLNVVGNLRDSHGKTSATGIAVGTFGPVANTYLTFAREATGGLLPHAVRATQTADVVVNSLVLLVALAPVVAAVVARRTLRLARPLLTLLTWATVAVLVSSYVLITPSYGFLTAGLALLLVLLAACVVTRGDVDLRSLRSAVSWLAAALVVYAAGSSWVPLMPFAGFALVAWFGRVFWSAASTGPWSRLRLATLCAVPTALLGWALYAQYSDVVSPIGGGDALLVSPGGTPAATEVLVLVAFALVGCGWVAYSAAGTARRWSVGFATPLQWLLGYMTGVILLEAWVTGQPPHYGSIKLLFVLVGAIVALGTADLLASPFMARQELRASVVVVIAVVFAATVQQGPIAVAAAGHWPKPVPQPVWVPTVNRLVAGSARVLCIAMTAAPDESPPNLDAYTCSRWASSLQGHEDQTSLKWRFVDLGREPAADSVALVKQAKDKPWVVVVIGSLADLKNPKAWYAPIVSQPGLRFVQAGT